MSDADRRSLRAAQTLSARRRSQGACRLYFTDYTLAVQKSFSVLEVSRRQAALSVMGVLWTMLAIFISPITLCLVPGCFSVLGVRGRSRGTSTGETNPEVSGREQSRRRLGVSPRFIIPQTLHGCRKLLRVGPLDNLLNLLLG